LIILFIQIEILSILIHFMIPKKLIFKGLYSYKDVDNCVIDFDRLNQAGLFGIFGATGSGKSSILEAMLIALFDSGVRFNGRASDNDLMNLDSDSLYIDFEFEAQGIKFRRIVEGRRNSKTQVAKIETPQTLQMIEGVWTPLSKRTEAKDLIGLGIEEFTKTVIIPQDKFRAFIDLSASKRVTLLSELFDLKKYDLRDKVGSLTKKNQLALSNLEGQLNGIGEVNPTMIQQLTKELTQIKALFEADNEKLTALDALRQLFIEKNNTENQITSTTLSIAQLDTQLIDNEQFIQNNKIIFEQLKKDYDSRQTLKDKAKDLESLLKIKTWEIETNLLVGRISNGEKILTEEESKLELLNQTKEKAASVYEKLSLEKPDFQRLQAVRQWFTQFDNLEIEALRLKTEEQRLQERLDADAQSTRVQFVELRKISPDLPQLNKPNEGILFIKKQIELITKKQEHIDELVTTHRTAERLEEFSRNLAEGEPCPLCGATHHPSVLTAQSVAQELANAQNQKEQLRQSMLTLANIERAFEGIHKGILDTQEAMRKVNLQQTETTQKQTQHHKNFIWSPDFSPTNKAGLEQAEAVAIGFNKQLDEAYKASTTANEVFQNQRDKIVKFQGLIQDLRHKKEQFETQIRVTTEGVTSDINKKEWLSKEPIELESNIKSLDNQYNTITKDFEYLNLQFETKQKSITLLQGQKLSSGQQLSILNLKKTELMAAIGDKIYDEAAHENLKQLRDERQIAIGSFTNQIADAKAKLEKIETLKKQEKTLHEREANLKILSRLFRGDGFTGYVANTFLKNVCGKANEWFMRFTKNCLRLEVDESNQLLVRDILNQGLLRSIDTLSGGQKFQASLALALALSDNIQGKSGTEQRFFFLDEGFGSLDRDALRIVFETLNLLKEKGRIVGVISHVEEMQQEIGQYLKVELDETKGSFVKMM
jgi:DNA repair protein SbcC/Rad50